MSGFARSLLSCFGAESAHTWHEIGRAAVCEISRMGGPREHQRESILSGLQQPHHMSDRTCQAEDFQNVRRLGIHICLAISREAGSQDALHVGEVACGLDMSP